jgi:integrase
MRRSLLRPRFLLATAAEHSMRIVTISARSSSGPPTSVWPYWRRPDRTSSCTALPSRSGDWQPPPSTGACRRRAASTGSLTSTPHRREPRPVRPPAEGPTQRRARHGCGELGTFLFTAERVDRDHAALAVLLGLNGLRVSDACATNIEDLGFERGHRTLRILGKGNKPAVITIVPRTARTIDLAVGERHEGPILRRRDGQRLDRRTAHRWVRSIGKRTALGAIHPHMLRAAFIMAALDAGVPLRDVQIAARHADPRTTTVYDRRRENFDRHAAYVVVAFVTGG